MEKEFIITTFKQQNIPLSDKQVNQFLSFYELLIETNKLFNLTSITEFDEVVEKHFLDSCLNYSTFLPYTSVCDIGSGAGFPAIPLKIVRPDLKITMVDSLNKRVNFLNECIQKLELENINAIHSRAQELSEVVGRENFDYVTARAVAPLNILLELCAPYVKVGGKVIALKSNNAELELTQAKNAIKILGLKLEKIENYEINSKTEKFTRKIINFVKESKTPTQYPRKKNKVTTNPL